MSDIKVVRLVSTDKPLEVGTASKPKPGPKDVLVKVLACSIVPNTFNLITGKADEHTDGETTFTLAKAPLVFGLDVSGVVEEIGEHVQNIAKGDRVYVNPWLTCDTCQACRTGRTDLCPSGALRGYFAMKEGGVKTLQRYPLGGLSEYVLSPDANICVLPESIPLDTAARFGYIGTSYGALAVGDVGPGKTVLINGVTGTLGYAAVAIALGLGAVKILGIGRNPDRLKHVASLDPDTERVSVVSSEDEKDIAKWVQDQTGGLGVDCLVDCLGVGGDAESTTRLIDSVKSGGKAVLVAGGVDGEIKQHYLQAMSRSVSIVGSNWFTTGQVDELAAMVASGNIDLSFLEPKVFSLENVNQAMKFVGDRPGGSVNVLVKPGAQ